MTHAEATALLVEIRMGLRKHEPWGTIRRALQMTGDISTPDRHKRLKGWLYADGEAWESDHPENAPPVVLRRAFELSEDQCSAVDDTAGFVDDHQPKPKDSET